MALIQGREYEWADLTLIAGGKDLTGIRGVSWKKKIEREHLHAKGRNANSVQSGNITVDGEVTVLQSTFIGLQKSGGGSILGLNIDMMLAYGNPSNGDPMETNRIVGVRFTEEMEEWKQGDKFIEIKLPFLALDVK